MLAEIYLVRLEMMLRNAAAATRSDTRFVPITPPRTPTQDGARKTA
jgi:hypothetical protein